MTPASQLVGINNSSCMAEDDAGGGDKEELIWIEINNNSNRNPPKATVFSRLHDS